jgi:hypothetical protein
VRLRASGLLRDVRYEDLLQDPWGEAEAIHGFLGQPFSRGSLEPVLGRIAADNARKWKIRLTPAQIRTFESVAGASLGRLGYETTWPEAPVDPWRRRAWALEDTAGRFVHRVGLNTVDWFRIRFLGMEPFAEDDTRPASRAREGSGPPAERT